MSQQSFDTYNAFLADGDLDRFAKIFARYEFFKMVTEIPGDIVECGVYKGQGLLFWAKLIQIFNPLSTRKVIGFDTFTGAPKTVRNKKDREGAQTFKDYQDVPETVMKTAKKFNIENRIEIISGDALKTIPKFVKSNPGFRIALLNLDFDVYEPTYAALDSFYDRVVGGGIITLDEYAVPNWGESNAVDSFAKKRKIKLELESLPWALSPTAYFKKPTLFK